MKTLKCDPLYIQHCMKNGFVIRLNKKHDRDDEMFVKEFVTFMGISVIHPMLHILVKIKDMCFENAT